MIRHVKRHSAKNIGMRLPALHIHVGQHTRYYLNLRGMSTQHKVPFYFCTHITSYRTFLKFGTVGQPSINGEMYRIKKPGGGKILEL